ncbi:hypothetical protein OAO87_02295 [bacterium]|nr:hypothetical protein [bacterium]
MRDSLADAIPDRPELRTMAEGIAVFKDNLTSAPVCCCYER